LFFYLAGIIGYRYHKTWDKALKCRIAKSKVRWQSLMDFLGGGVHPQKYFHHLKKFSHPRNLNAGLIK
jgi:hypothetical protein